MSDTDELTVDDLDHDMAALEERIRALEAVSGNGFTGPQECGCPTTETPDEFRRLVLHLSAHREVSTAGFEWLNHLIQDARALTKGEA